LQRVRIHLFTIIERLHLSKFGVEAQNLLTAKKMSGYGIGLLFSLLSMTCCFRGWPWPQSPLFVSNNVSCPLDSKVVFGNIERECLDQDRKKHGWSIEQGVEWRGESLWEHGKMTQKRRFEKVNGVWEQSRFLAFNGDTLVQVRTPYVAGALPAGTGTFRFRRIEDPSISGGGECRNGLRHGVWTEKSGNDIVRQISYENGFRHGQQIDFAPNEPDVLSARGTFDHGVRVGIWQFSTQGDCIDWRLGSQCGNQSCTKWSKQSFAIDYSIGPGQERDFFFRPVFNTTPENCNNLEDDGMNWVGGR
jgi:hypothetical protein